MKSIGFAVVGVLLVAGLIYFSGRFTSEPAATQPPAQPVNTVGQEAAALNGSGAASQSGAATQPETQSPAGPRTLEWEELMHPEDLSLLEAMTPVDHENMSESELAKDQQPRKKSLKPDPSLSQFEQAKNSGEPQKRTWKDALVSTRTRPELDKQLIKIPGYIVPLEYNAEQQLTDFFLVPYFGACIHVPPPPPNQIIYVRIPKGMPLQDIYTPYWVQGTLKIETKENDLGVSSYSLDALSVEVYQE